MACVKICVNTDGIGSLIENSISLLILAGAGYIAYLYPQETFWWLFNGLTWLGRWIIKLGLAATIISLVGCVTCFYLEEKWHQWFAIKSPDHA